MIVVECCCGCAVSLTMLDNVQSLVYMWLHPLVHWCKKPSTKDIRKNLNPLWPVRFCPHLAEPSPCRCPHLHTSATGWLTSNWYMDSCHRPRSHRQQTSSDLSAPFSTARAVTVGVIRIAVHLHASTASLSAMLSCGRLHPIKSLPPLSAFVRTWANSLPLLDTDVLYGQHLTVLGRPTYM